MPSVFSSSFLVAKGSSDRPITRYDVQNATVQARFKKMVQDGQIGFNEGGWVQPDEGATNYLGRINQATLGQEWLADRLNYFPTSGWHMDPFGNRWVRSGLHCDRSEISVGVLPPLSGGVLGSHGMHASPCYLTCFARITVPSVMPCVPALLPRYLTCHGRVTVPSDMPCVPASQCYLAASV